VCKQSADCRTGASSRTGSRGNSCRELEPTVVIKIFVVYYTQRIEMQIVKATGECFFFLILGMRF
jgi:hypothetical protein